MECPNNDLQSNSWTPEANMTSLRYAAAAVRFSDDLWWVTGGYDGISDQQSTELYNATDKTWYPYVDLPKPMVFHNLVSVSDTHVILLGGYSKSSDVYMFDRYLL